MNGDTANRLIELNKQFYQTFGREFASTRLRLQPGVKQVLERLQGDESILDLGCGNGELARELMRRGHHGPYTGVDYSVPQLEIARHGWEDDPKTFIKADLLSENWEKRLVSSPGQPFDWGLAFAVLHHIPGKAARAGLLQKARALIKPRGLFIHSEWQFLASEKLRGRIQPWESAGLSSADVDTDDYLLDWRSGGRGLRYVHHFSEEELEELAGLSGFKVHETFRSDGANGLLGLYQVWEAV